MTTAGTGVCVLRQNSRKKKRKAVATHVLSCMCGEASSGLQRRSISRKKTTTQICLEANSKNLQLVPIKLLIE